MSTDRPEHTGTDGECTTTGSFATHGIDDGSRLVSRTYYRLADGGPPEFAPTESFFDRLETAFIWAYLESTGGTDVPDGVLTAVDDARARTAEELADEPGADLRTTVVPTFYRRVAGFHCAYHRRR